MDSRRRARQWETAFGFALFFAVVSVIQAVINVLRPDPQVWPAFLALFFVSLAFFAYRRWRDLVS